MMFLKGLRSFVAFFGNLLVASIYSGVSLQQAM